jgi:hypothetical protein
MAFSTLISPIASIAENVLDRVLPRKATESEKHVFRSALEEQLFRHDWAPIEAEIADRTQARGLAATAIQTAGKGWQLALTVIHRPIWSLAVLAVYVASWAFEKPMSDLHKDVALRVIEFYFAGRTIEKISSIIATRKDKS